jgi:2-phosphoglycerate kinase
VLLIAGCSGVGKTVVAQKLGRKLGISALLVDDLRIATQAITTPTCHPDLHVFRTDRSIHEMGPDQAVRGFIAVASAMAPAVLTVVAHHLVVEGAGPLIVEGDALLPTLTANQPYADLKLFQGLAPTQAVRMVVIHEPDDTQLLANFRTRGRGFADLTPDEQRSLVTACCTYGDWLKNEAISQRVPVVAARPHQSLATRVLAAAQDADPPPFPALLR